MKDGFEIVPDVLAAAELDDLSQRLDAAPITRSRAGARHLLRLEAVAAIARDPRMIEIAATALGAAPTAFGATLFDKSPETNWLVSWHQDTALPISRRQDRTGWGPWSEKDGVTYAHAPAAALEHVVALRLHLDDSTTGNGPLRVLPETHRLGVLSDAQVRVQAQQVNPVTCLVARGGVLMMRPLLIHASSKVTSSESRRVIHLEYSACVEFAGGIRLHKENGLPACVGSP